MQTQVTPRRVIEEETLELGEKPQNSAKNLSAALQAVIDPLDNQLGYMAKQETLQA